MGSPKALMCPLKRGLGGLNRLGGLNKSSSDDRPGPGICDGGIEILTRHHQMPGRSWRAGESCGDGEPEGRDRPLEKGVGGIDSGARSVRVWDRVPIK